MIHFDFTVTWVTIIAFLGSGGGLALGYRIWRFIELFVSEHNVMFKYWCDQHGIKLTKARLARTPQIIFVHSDENGKANGEHAAHMEPEKFSATFQRT